MRPLFSIITCLTIICSCSTQQKESKPSIIGTWKLIDATVIEKGNTTVTDYSKDKEFIKIINATHFSFIGHDLNKGKDSSTALFSSGAGTYTLSDTTYTEHLQYCSDRAWENSDFSFTIKLTADTLIQKGIEKVEAAGVDRINMERYVRIKEGPSTTK